MALIPNYEDLCNDDGKLSALQRIININNKVEQLRKPSIAPLLQIAFCCYIAIFDSQPP